MKLYQRFLVIGSGFVFLGLMMFPLMNMFQDSSQQPPPTAAGTAPNLSSQEQLEAIAKGYESVLKREPNNPTALQGAAEARLKMGDLKGGLVPLKKLAQLYPQEQELPKLIKAIELQLAAQEQQPSQPQAPANQK